jgi:hypothetical protein
VYSPPHLFDLEDIAAKLVVHLAERRRFAYTSHWTRHRPKSSIKVQDIRKSDFERFLEVAGSR